MEEGGKDKGAREAPIGGRVGGGSKRGREKHTYQPAPWLLGCPLRCSLGWWLHHWSPEHPHCADHWTPELCPGRREGVREGGKE